MERESYEEVAFLLRWRTVIRGVGYAVLFLVLAAGAFWAGTRANAVVGVAPAPAYADEPATAAPSVSDRAAEIGGEPVGEVLINDTVVIRMRETMGGFTPHERAMIVADRLQRWLSGPYSPYDVAAREGAGEGAELRAAGQLIVTISPAEAAPQGSTALGLAEAWRDNIMMALGVGGEVEEPPPGEVAPAEWAPPEDYQDKIVPIVSVLEGVKVGAARVNGPASKVDQVAAVAQLETHFKNYLEIDIYVPITTNEPGPGGLNRVQQVGVTGLGDIEI